MVKEVIVEKRGGLCTFLRLSASPGPTHHCPPGSMKRMFAARITEQDYLVLVRSTQLSIEFAMQGDCKQNIWMY